MTTDRSREEQGSRLCQSCGLCCNGAVCDKTVVSPEKDTEFVQLFEKHIVSAPDGKRLWLDQPCVAFGGTCNHYEIRPVDCRTYTCALLRKYLSGEIAFDDASEIVRHALTSLDRASAQFNAQQGQFLTRDEIYPVLSEMRREAEAKGLQ